MDTIKQSIESLSKTAQNTGYSKATFDLAHVLRDLEKTKVISYQTVNYIQKMMHLKQAEYERIK
jgi:hypothetical protein